MLKEKLAEIRSAETSAATLIENARLDGERRLRNADQQVQEIAAQAKARAQETIIERLTAAKPGIDASTALLEEANRAEIAEIRTRSAARMPEAIDLVVTHVTSGLGD